MSDNIFVTNNNVDNQDLPKQYDPLVAQSRWSRYWDDLGLFQVGRNSIERSVKGSFCVVIPPPNVTGALHMGHALNNTLQDITVRMKRMQGYDTLWIPGVDHAGIATQAVVEKRLFEEEKLTRHDIGRDALVGRIWNWKEKYQTRIIEQLKGMGCSCDWSRTRFTLDEICAKAVRYFFFNLFKQNLIYRGKRLVNWDTHLQTAVSDDEVFYETVDGNFWHIKYPIVEPKVDEFEFVIVATTRPETMLGDTAVAVHPDPENAINKIHNDIKKRLETASEKEKSDLQKELDNIESLKSSGQIERLKKLAQLAKSGCKIKLPLSGRIIPLIADAWAKPDKGTGCVKITPAHDPNDYEVGLRNDLPMINILNKDGTLNSAAGVYEGLTIKAAREKVVSDLDAGGFLHLVEERTIELAHSDRSKTPIEPFLHDQWFVKMASLAQTAIDTVKNGEVKILPERYTKGYIDWLSEKRDWPIGRQLWWGHRIPIWSCKNVTKNEIEKTFNNRNDISFIRDDESGEWRICSLEEDLPEDAIKDRQLVREEDVLDTWFSSALWTHSTLGWPDVCGDLEYYYPTGVLITNRDILTLWVARMVLAGKFNTGKKPFHEVYIHPTILDKYGERMSKSLGNGVDPISVITKFGADAMRFGLAFLTTENQDIRLVLDFECPYCGAVVEQTKKNRKLPKIQCPKCKKNFRTQWAEKDDDKNLPEGMMINERFEVARNFCNKLWNAARFVLLSLGDKKIDSVTINKNLGSELLEDKWILSRLATVTRDVTQMFETYHYAEAVRLLYDFAWDEFCSFYLEMVKSRLSDNNDNNDNNSNNGNNDNGNNGQSLVAESILVYVLRNLICLLHPVTPFVTEEIWQRLRKLDSNLAVSVAVAEWGIADNSAVNVEIEERFKIFQELLRAIRDVRASRNIPPKDEIKFAVKCNKTTATLLKPMEKYFLTMAKAKATEWGESVEIPEFAATTPLTGMDLYVDLSGVINLNEEIKKLEKEIEKIKNFITAKEKKLDGDFIKKAPKQIVEKEQQSLTDLKEQLNSATNAIKKLIKIKSNQNL
ncbi:MAG: class I tRNA ligase family protein [Planctomycetaceae bacterium]|jgi:valyl-tRNA synthetase|nr:class I tRNA ligase family protein [Planctomycetaceae bacterium]